MILPTLFSSGLLHIQRILNLYSQVVIPIVKKPCNIKGKTGIPTPVTTCKLAVDPNLCYIVRAFKMQDIAIALQLDRIHTKVSVIPHIFMTGFISDTAGCRFIGKRNANGALGRKIAVPLFLLAYIAVIKGKIPYSVQILPVVANKLRSGIIFYIALHTSHPYLLISIRNLKQSCFSSSRYSFASSGPQELEPIPETL